MSGLREHGRKLLHNGYAIVPIKPGTKNPCMKGWQSIEADDALLSRWLSNGRGKDGVGVLTANTPCIDIDVQDAAVVDEIIRKTELLIGRTPQRIGMPPKTALYFRTNTPFHKLASARYADSDGQEHRVEILGEGQQSVLYAVHPDTGKPYSWPEGSIADYRHDDLSELTEAKARELIDWFDSLALASGWRVVETANKQHNEADSEFTALDNAKPPIGKPKAIAEALKNISPDCSHDEWVKIGMGLHHEYNGDAQGFELWNDWSAEGDKYPGVEECRRKWQTFDVNLGRTNPVTAATILMMGKRDPMAAFIERYVYVVQGNQVADLEAPPHLSLRPMSAFQNEAAKVRVEVPAPTQRDPDRTKLEAAWRPWLIHPDRQTALGKRYMPNGPRVFTDEGAEWINTFSAPSHDGALYDSKELEIFTDHLTYLIPDEIDRAWFMGWMARILQQPEKRCHVVPVHICPAEGSGRGWVLHLIEALIGDHNVRSTEMRKFVESDFNDFLSDCLVCAIEEAKEKGLQYEITERIKEKVEAPRLLINRKYGTQQMEPVFANVVIFSNHYDAFTIDENNRRIYVIAGPEEVQDLDYFKRLYGALKRPAFVATVFHYLKSLDISGLNFLRPRHNEARMRMVAATQNETEWAFWQAFNDPSNAVTQLNDFMDSVRHYIEEGGGEPLDMNEKQVKAMFRANAGEKRKVKIESNVSKWVFVLNSKNTGNRDWREIAKEKYSENSK